MQFPSNGHGSVLRQDMIVVVGLLVLLKPKSKRGPHTTSSAADNKGWALTGRIDFVDPHSNGDLLLQVEETQIVNSPGGVEHREFVGEGRH